MVLDNIATWVEGVARWTPQGSITCVRVGVLLFVGGGFKKWCRSRNVFLFPGMVSPPLAVG